MTGTPMSWSRMPDDERCESSLAARRSGDGRHRRDVRRRAPRSPGRARSARRARAGSASALLVTFDPHPLEVVNPAAAPLLLTVGDEKLEVLAECGYRLSRGRPVHAEPRLASRPRTSWTRCSRALPDERICSWATTTASGETAPATSRSCRRSGARAVSASRSSHPVSVGDGRPISSTSIRRADRRR